MASFYEDASLVVIPSGYKTSKIYAEKPTDGSGDLDVTRASDATRVDSNGLIEKVRTNEILQSNTFSNASWTKANSTVTSGQAGYDGTTNGWKITATGTSSVRIIQNVTTTGLINISTYLKAGNVNFAVFEIGSSAAWFNLSNGTIGSSGSIVNYKIDAAGNGYYRCSISLTNASANNLSIYLTNADGSVSAAVNDFIYIQNLQVETGDIATDYIPTTTAAVSVGPVSNVPRLDYLGSTCPRLLLEPQRTNVLFYSESFDNAYWNKAGTSVLANNTTSPDGSVNADKLTSSGAGGDEYIQRAALTTTVGTYTSSIFIKNVNATATVLMAVHIGEGSVTSDMRYTWSTNTFTLAGTNAVAGKVTNYGNGWVRLEFTYTIGASVTGHWFRTYVQTGVSTNSIFIWGAQVEAGAYATSYIPTLGASVTRVADAASKTGISSLIGQTEGTIFIDLVWNNSLGDVVPFDVAGSDGKLIWMRGIGAQFYGNGTTLIADIGRPGAVQGTRYKIAFVYGQNDFRLYRNGSLIGTDTSGTFTGTFSDIALNSVINQANAFNQILLFKTKLTNAQLAELTTL
jgi:hypothetical protein